MDHSHMDHGHAGHEGMNHGHGEMPMCSMNMLFTWSTENLCIVFPQWRITSTLSLLVSLVAVILLTAAYEGIRSLARKYEETSAEYMNTLPIEDDEDHSWKWLGQNIGQARQRTKVVKAALYAVQIFYSFFIMLLFMTYNGWIMIAVAIGAFVGYLSFGSDVSAAKEVSCH